MLCYTVYVCMRKMDVSQAFLNEFVRQMNMIRRNPKSIIADVQATSYPSSVKTETINYLNSVKPCTNTMVLDPLLTLEAQAYAYQQGVIGATGHGPFQQRVNEIRARVADFTSIGENLSYGFTSSTQTAGSFQVPAMQGCIYYSNDREVCSDTITTVWLSPRTVILEWIIDNGVPDKGHRHSIFNCNFTTLGVGVAPHKEYRIVVSNLYASGWLPKP